ncbi:MAG: glycosyltransferase family 4 protein [Planctomycetes bacterium]|nr:glycosyltransferase family 4 protein [Planctomycetota bacterium]
MNILLLSFEYPHETGFGGIGTYTWYHARALVRLGHRVHVLAGANAPTDLRVEEHDGVVVHRYRADDAQMRRIEGLGARHLWWTRHRLGNAWSFLHGVDRLAERHAFDVIEAPDCGGEAALVAPLRAIPTVVKFHSPARLIMRYYDVRPEDIVFTGLVERMAIEAAVGHTSCSAGAAAQIRDEMDFRRPIEVVANGIDLALFDADETVDVRERHGIPRDVPMVLFSGRMEGRKGIDQCPPIVLRLLERQRVAVVFAGDDLFGYVTRQFQPLLAGRDLRGSVHFLGRVPLADARALARACDVFWMPSRWEGCPYACLEAMAARRAVVASRGAGMPELVVDGDTGLLADLHDAAAQVEALERLLEDPALRGRMGEAARRRIQRHYTDTAIAAQSVDHYRHCLQGAHERPPARGLHGELVDVLGALVGELTTPFPRPV